MQCYSLATKLQKDFPHDKIEVIDYLSEKIFLGYRPSVSNYLKLVLIRPGLRAKGRTIKNLIMHIFGMQKNISFLSGVDIRGKC